MSELTPELRAEIAQHFRVSPTRAAMVIRDMELGLTVEQMAAQTEHHPSCTPGQHGTEG